MFNVAPNVNKAKLAQLLTWRGEELYCRRPAGGEPVVLASFQHCPSLNVTVSQNFLTLRGVADGVERLGADPRLAAELRLGPGGDVAGL